MYEALFWMFVVWLIARGLKADLTHSWYINGHFISKCGAAKKGTLAYTLGTIWGMLIVGIPLGLILLGKFVLS